MRSMVRTLTIRVEQAIARESQGNGKTVYRGLIRSVSMQP